MGMQKDIETSSSRTKEIAAGLEIDVRAATAVAH